MSDFESMVIPQISAICLVVGYILKNIVTSTKINRYIPAVVVALGIGLAIWNAISKGEPVTIDVVGDGVVTGCTATGIHQFMQRTIMQKDEE